MKVTTTLIKLVPFFSEISLSNTKTFHTSIGMITSTNKAVHIETVICMKC